MANQKHLDIIKQGVDVWNKWREDYPDVEPCLRFINLHDIELISINLNGADLTGANLNFANLTKAQLIGANLNMAHFIGANLAHSNLTGAYLIGACFAAAQLIQADLTRTHLNAINFTLTKLVGSDLTNADLTEADLTGADLTNASLYKANLTQADLTNAFLAQANLTGTNLTRSNLTNAVFEDCILASTIFGETDLSSAKGLDIANHQSPSTIGIDTIINSHGHIPEIFLREAGVPQSIIEQIPALIGSLRPIDYYSCFISYSSNDEEFANRLHADLQQHGVRCWFAPEDLKIGDKFRHRIDESIRIYDKLLLVLSEASIASTWVGYEVEKALDKEPEGKPNVLFPIRLDKAILTCETDWARDIRSSRHIGDFEHWKDHDTYQIAFERLLRDLKAQS